MSGRSFLPKLTGSFSHPAGDNPTVVMMEAAYRHHGLDFRYINMEVGPEAEGLADAVRGAKAQGYVGFNCSLPHKVEVIQYLDGLGESASLIGAVNCVVKQADGRWIGENTDGKGFLSSLKGVIDPAGLHVALLGAGGAARAIAVELALAGVSELTLVNRSEARGAKLAEHLRQNTAMKVNFCGWSESFVVPGGVGVLVNATSIGLAPDGEAMPDVDLNSFREGLVVADVIPNPPHTRFLREARSRGCVTLDGLGMLVNQGAANMDYWTGVKPDLAVMKAVLTEIFGL
ncbi:shikimate dehydrogenase [Phragmitibacter flavus]|uniref:Shikimate dehydrogenase (NADP(+)) n=1 Tax=Phragmitibacter flavus TaxID=2576071 RepID=A0A5R8KGZ0_9BACT|nr:shikimate dehydrogenase [Phragmitibacter flavus]TLD70869.1 shikimate dehydrogenase [Phragmitibacter flavus]